jgi:hypothetical protein
VGGRRTPNRLCNSIAAAPTQPMAPIVRMMMTTTMPGDAMASAVSACGRAMRCGGGCAVRPVSQQRPSELLLTMDGEKRRLRPRPGFGSLQRRGAQSLSQSLVLAYVWCVRENVWRRSPPSPSSWKLCRRVEQNVCCPQAAPRNRASPSFFLSFFLSYPLSCCFLVIWALLTLQCRLSVGRGAEMRS